MLDPTYSDTDDDEEFDEMEEEEQPTRTRQQQPKRRQPTPVAAIAPKSRRGGAAAAPTMRPAKGKQVAQKGGNAGRGAASTKGRGVKAVTIAVSKRQIGAHRQRERREEVDDHRRKERSEKQMQRMVELLDSRIAAATRNKQQEPNAAANSLNPTTSSPSNVEQL